MKTIVVTGGPCGGKTTALGFLKEALFERGYVPVIVPECATALVGAGIAPWTVTRLEFQRSIFELQLAQEDIFGRAAAEIGDAVVLICDRGLMDGRGYLTTEEFSGLLAEHEITREEALGRYGAIFHLESTALGMSEAYTLENNASRMEDADEALEVERNIRIAWEEHPHRRIIGNEERFEDKQAHLLDEVLAYLGAPGA